MSRFFVGQRVRIKWSTGWPELAGQEGRITSRSPTRGRTGRSDWRVAPDCWGTHAAPYPAINGAGVFAPSSDQIEPIQPDGARPSEFTTLHDLLSSLEGVRA